MEQLHLLCSVHVISNVSRKTLIVEARVFTIKAPNNKIILNCSFNDV